jgi:type IV secretory pathway VirB10-like protein
MTETNQNPPVTVPEQPEAKPPLRKGMPVVIALVAILAILGIANVSSLLRGNKKAAPASSLQMRPVSPNAQQVSSFETQQQLQAKHDAEERERQQQLMAAMQQLQATEGAPGPEYANAAPMTSAQRDTVYGGSPNAPQHTSNVSEAQAEAKQKPWHGKSRSRMPSTAELLRLTSSIPAGLPPPRLWSASEWQTPQGKVTPADVAGGAASGQPTTAQTKATAKTDPMGPYEFDQYQGRLYRIFEGTVLEGVVTNHIDGGFSGPILVMLTTDYYSHDHQQFLMPQGTRLIGTVQSVGNAQQRKMFVTFHRAVCPDGFSLDFDKYIGLDPLGTTGLATKVDHGYLMAFGAAAAIGGLGGLAQIGNNSSVLDPSTQIRNGISEQTAAEGEQVLNHFLNRLPIITLKEGSRARVYVGRDILIPSYAEHRMDPTL